MVRKAISLFSAMGLVAAAAAWAGAYFIQKTHLGGNDCYRFGYTAASWVGLVTVYPSGLLRLQYYGDNPGFERGLYSRPAPLDPAKVLSTDNLKPRRYATPMGSLWDVHLGWPLAAFALVLELAYVLPRFIRRRRFRRLQCLSCGHAMTAAPTRRCVQCGYDNPYIVIEKLAALRNETSVENPVESHTGPVATE